MALPAATIPEGPLGIEGVLSANGFTANDLTSFPRARVRRVTGLHSKDITDAAMPNTGRIGETPLPTLDRGKTVVYEGILEIKKPLLLPDLRIFEQEMKAAFQMGTVYDWTIAPPAARGGVEWGFAARVLQLTLDDEQVYGPSRQPSPHLRSFVLGLKQYDPRYYADDVQQATGVTAGTTHTFDNEGNAPAEPTFEFPGDPALDQVEVRNQTTDRKLIFTGLTGLVDTGETFRIDFANREAYNVQTAQDLSGRMDVELSTWWDEAEPGIIPGTNVIWGGGTGTTTWSASFLPASW